MSSHKQLETNFREYLKRISHYSEAIGLIAWDLRTGAPKKGIEQRSLVLGTLSSDVFHMSTSDDMSYYIEEMQKEQIWSKLNNVTKAAVKVCEKDLKKLKNIPKEEYKKYTILTVQAESAWEDAKKNNDFSSFQPYLEKIVAFNRKYVEWVGYEGNKYNALLNDYEPGITVEMVDKVFAQLKEAIVPLVKEIENSNNQPKTDFLFEHFPAKKQKALCIELLESMEYDFDAGRLDKTIHPFAIGLNPGDVRVTTKYLENDFRSAVFGTIHEGGHALYEQNIDKKFIGTPLATGTSMGIHESQSLFWEKFVGKNKAYWEKYYEVLKKYAPEQFEEIILENFYRAINIAEPSFIRIEADELTYSLHIILRYELEKALINGDLEVKDLPHAWNKKMEELLGIRPTSDSEGVLQDVHWASGSFGYFPSYALGYVYAAQLKNAMDKDIENFEDLLREGKLTPIKEWLRKHVHQFGKSKQPLEIIKDTTGGGMDASFLIEYLENKYRTIYGLN